MLTYCNRSFIVFLQIGSIGVFDLLTLFINVTVAFGLLALANLVTDFLGAYLVALKLVGLVGVFPYCHVFLFWWCYV